ncbi:hypothetical protein [Streptomyces beigongshangae]|uniref:hypothetical protein n=1 Tax=Streptomyces beigongshangae TaxID=2841597 RepID=UPI001C85CFAB|nr:hypothetical protein [Streptomyces sp. REN17]
MSFCAPQGPSPSPDRTAGALLLCRAEADAVEPVVRLLRDRVLLVPAGREWCVLVPEGRPWLRDDEPVDRVLAGWATALAVAAPWTVLALWWDADHSGCTLATGFRRTVGYEWLANGTAVGEDEAMRTFAARLGLDPVLDARSLACLTEPDPRADARGRLRALLAVLARVGVALPDGLEPGDPADRLHAVVRDRPGDVRTVERPGDVRTAERPGREHAVREGPDAVRSGRPGSWPPWAGPTGASGVRALALAQLGTGAVLVVRGLRGRRGAGWSAAGAVLMAYGGLGAVYGFLQPRDCPPHA